MTANIPQPLYLPWPPASLSGHAKGHWRGKAKVTKQHRVDAYWAAVEAGWHKLDLADGDIRLRVTFTPPDNRGDRVNYPNRIKPYIDGIADAMNVNDKRFCIPEYAVAAVDKSASGVVFTIINGEGEA